MLLQLAQAVPQEQVPMWWDGWSVMLIVVITVAVMAAILLAAVPGLIANSRRHRQRKAIWICGYAGLFSGILWLVAIIWSFTDNVEPRTKRSRTRRRIRSPMHDAGSSALEALSEDTQKAEPIHDTAQHIDFPCASCGKTIRASISYAGRNVACPGCGGAVPVPQG